MIDKEITDAYAWIDSEIVPIWLTCGRVMSVCGNEGSNDYPYLKEKTIASLLLDGRLDTKRVCHGQVVSDDLDLRIRSEMRPSLPVILVKWILDGYDRVFLDQLKVNVCELLSGDPLCWVGVRVLEVQVILAILVKFGRRDIESDLDLALVASLLDCLHEQLKGFLSTAHVRRKSTLVAHVRRCQRLKENICVSNSGSPLHVDRERNRPNIRMDVRKKYTKTHHQYHTWH